MKKGLLLVCLSALLMLAAGCGAQNGENAVNPGAGALAEDPPSEASLDNGEWTAYIDGEHNLCVQKKGDAAGSMIVEDVAEAPCVAGEWVYYLPNLDEIDKVRLDGSQKTKVCDTGAFQVYNAKLDMYHEINGSTSVEAKYQNGYIFYTCVQLREAGDEQTNPPSYYQLDLEQNTLTQVEN